LCKLGGLVSDPSVVIVAYYLNNNTFFAYRPAAAGSQDLIEFYTSSSITLVSLDVF